MQFLILANFNEVFDRKSAAEKQASMEAEWAKSREYYAKGLLRHIWLSPEQQAITSIFDVESRAQMDALLADYPGLKEGFVTAEIREAQPYGGFAPEFAS